MTTKRWRMVVADLGGDDIVNEVTVDGDNWMSALRKGREAIGESGGIPTGSSCAVEPDGKVTILDPISRRRFVLSVDASTSYRPPAPTGLRVPADPSPKDAEPAAKPASPSPKDAEPAAKPASPSPKDAEPAAKPASEEAAAPQAAPSSPVAPRDTTAQAKPARKAPRSTMAYIPAGALPTPEELAADLAARAEASAAEAKAPSAATGPAAPASETAGATPESAPTPSVPEAAPVEPAGTPAPAETPSATQGAAPEPGGDLSAPSSLPPSKLLAGRDEDPSDASPLTYRERSYSIDASVEQADAESVARARLDELLASVEGAPRGRFLNVAVFDHAWETKPSRPPVVTAVLKDWQGQVVIERPLEAYRATRPASAPPPAAIPAPTAIPAAAETASAPAHTPPAKKRRTTDEHDSRLADAFEACQDLLFLSTPIEAMEFVGKLLKDLVPSEALTACLYDIDANVLRVVLVRGADESRRGSEIPAGTGLLGGASSMTKALRVDSLSAESRFNSSTDTPGASGDNALILPIQHQGRFLAAIMLRGRTGKPVFASGDADLGTYVSEQLAAFLHQKRTAASH